MSNFPEPTNFIRHATNFRICFPLTPKPAPVPFPLPHGLPDISCEATGLQEVAASAHGSSLTEKRAHAQSQPSGSLWSAHSLSLEKQNMVASAEPAFHKPRTKTNCCFDGSCPSLHMVHSSATLYSYFTHCSERGAGDQVNKKVLCHSLVASSI